MSEQQQTPKPDSALKRLDMMVGTWDLKGRTVDSKVDNVFARNTFEWLPGGFFLKSIFDCTLLGGKIWSLELIGYDIQSNVFPSTDFSNLVVFPIPYRYEVKDRR